MASKAARSPRRNRSTSSLSTPGSASARGPRGSSVCMSGSARGLPPLGRRRGRDLERPPLDGRLWTSQVLKNPDQRAPLPPPLERHRDRLGLHPSPPLGRLELPGRPPIDQHLHPGRRPALLAAEPEQEPLVAFELGQA